MNIQETIDCIRTWGEAKGITGPQAKGTPAGQLAKLQEEVSELELAWAENDKGEMIDAIGDCTVVLILLSELLNLKYEYCVETAYEIIAQRKGAMINGQFVKEAE